MGNSVVVSPRKPPHSANIRNIDTEDISQLGGYIYSPVTTDSGDTVIVNQGWIPKEQLPSDSSAESKSGITKKASFEGLITPLKNIPEFVKKAANCNVSD